jgi:hypothetical protein
MLKVEQLVQGAQVDLRHLRDVTAKADLGDRVEEEAAHVRQLVRETQDVLEQSYPTANLLPEIRTIAATLEAREKLAQETEDLFAEEMAAWDVASRRVERKVSDVVGIVAPTVELGKRESLKAHADRTVLIPLHGARARATVVLNTWHTLAEDARVTTLGFAPVLAAAENREETFVSLRAAATKVFDDVDDVVEHATDDATTLAATLRELSLLGGKGKSAGLPVVGAGLRPITQIYEIKPPPSAARSQLTADSSVMQSWYARAFRRVVNHRPALQLMHYFHPYYEGGSRLVVLGDNLPEACRAAALCASTHVRAGRDVTVFVPSAKVRDLLQNVVWEELYDVNLQQMVSGMGKKLSGGRGELKLLRASYRTVVVGELKLMEDCTPSSTGLKGVTHIALALTTDQLPAAGPLLLPERAKAPAPAFLSVAFIADATPDGAPDEAWHLFGLVRQDTGGWTIRPDLRDPYTHRMNGAVFSLLPELVRQPARREILLRQTSPESLARQRTPLAVLDLLLPTRAKRVTAADFSTDAGLVAVAPALLTLGRTVVESEKITHRSGVVQAVYVGSDLRLTDPALVKCITRVFRERYGYSDPGAAGAPAAPFQRSVVGCSSVAEWERLTKRPEGLGAIGIVVFSRINDPGFANVVRGKVSVLHRFMPIHYIGEKTRVERQFAPVSVLDYNWGTHVATRLPLVLPGPSALALDIGRLATQVAVNREALAIADMKLNKI